MATTTRDTEIMIDPDVPLVRITRAFDAPPAEVFRAHADPELLARWIGPHGMVTHVDQLDARRGGAYRYRQVDPEGNEHAFYGSFHEVRPGRLIVQTFTYEGVPEGVALERLEFQDIGEDRTRLVSTTLVDSFEGRDAFVASGMEQGVREGYERLAALLAR